ncbi:MAG: Glu/Leu/Phe/Val dehydrogenase [Acidimicrobiia bacterium]|nr:Glu/Leu/Phe/Val dehydrogenase [Acidimicrobiia bacterium]
MMDFDPLTQADDLGPAKVVHITERRTGLLAVVVIDNVAAGPAIGGVRMASDMTTAVCFRLARAMTLKNAMAGLRHGGAKAGIVADPRMPADGKEQLIRAFAASIRDLTDYIPGPDMGTNESAMAMVLDEIGRAVGLPPELGGLPLDELGATGFGVAESAEVAAPRLGIDLVGARVVVQGYGAVGRHAARFLVGKGAVLVAASDSRGGVVAPAGLDLDSLDGIKGRGGSVTECQGDVTIVDRDDVFAVECDMLIPAAGPDAIRADNVEEVKTRLILQGANIPITAEAEARLHQRGIMNLPDFVVNAGGVICGAVEYAHGSRSQAFQLIADTVGGNVEAVLDRCLESGDRPREVAMAMARSRVHQAMKARRWI